MSNTSSWLPVSLLFGVAVLGNVIHCSAASFGAWTEALPTLYCLPVVMAAVNLGRKPALGVAIASGIVYGVMPAIGCSYHWILPVAETILLVCVGLTSAKLATARGSLGAQHALPEGRCDRSLVEAFQGTAAVRSAPALREIADGLVRRFHTPVSSIEGAVWLLEDAHIQPERREEFLGIIRKETRQLERALSDILEFAQPRPPRLSKVDLAPLLDRVIQMAGPREHGPFLIFRKDIPPDLPALTGDPELITKMLYNMAVNAVQATPNGGQIRISATLEGDAVAITVKDPGRGITPGIAHRIFDPFFTTRENGLGLGLTVARQIAVAQGGKIAVNNMCERGTSITVVLPLNPPGADHHGPHTGS
jgi:signal transduction histidine kinase